MGNVSHKAYQPKIRVKASYDPELEQIGIEKLGLSVRAANALQRAKLFKVGQILDNWYHLDEFKGAGLGATSVREIHAAVFNILCTCGKVKLQLDTEQFIFAE